MWEDRAHRARRDIAALAATGLGVSELYEAAIRRVDREVRADLTCWAVLDPDTLVISTVISGEDRIPGEYEPLLAEAEYFTDQPHRWATLARRREAVARMSDLPERERRSSIRLNRIWRPLGLQHEIRTMFMTDGASWGAAGMVRSGRNFSDRESDFLAMVGPAIAGATRLAIRSEAHGWGVGRQPAIVIVSGQGEIRSSTPAAREWQDQLDEIAPGRFVLMMKVLAGGSRGSTGGAFRSRVRDAQGRWSFLRASPLMGDEDGLIAITIEPATGDELTTMLLLAYALSARERDVCREVIAGHTTTEIAARLFISSLTVQDHLKSIFGKVGVRSRGELVARIRPDAPPS